MAVVAVEKDGEAAGGADNPEIIVARELLSQTKLAKKRLKKPTDMILEWLGGSCRGRERR